MTVRLKQMMLVPLAIILLVGIPGFDAYSMQGMENMNGGMGHDKMFSAAPMDGCDDFHCQKCGDRNHCSGRSNCNMPGCGHEHALVLLNGGALFYLRSADGVVNENGRLSCYTRARQVVERLNQFMGMMKDHGRCYFTVLDENRKELVRSNQNPTIWFTMAGGGHFQKVITVTNSDLDSYRYRTASTGLAGMAKPAGELNKKLVAQWWAYLLKDYFAMVMENQPPRLTTYTHCGMVLDKVWAAARVEVPSGKIPMPVFKKAIDNLSDEDRTRLFVAAQIIPKNFDPNMR